MQTQTINAQMRALITDDEAETLRVAGKLLGGLRQRLFDATLDVPRETYELVHLGVAQERAENAREALFKLRMSLDIEALGEEE